MSGEVPRPITYVFTQWIFLRVLGLIYAIAFLSLATQVNGLVGSNGILPAVNFLSEVSTTPPDVSTFFELPTLAWFNCSDAFLQFLCWGGVLAGVGILLGVATAPLLVVAWLFYLSLSNIGQDFLSFQWDALLLEVGFLAIFWCPWQLLGPPWRGKLLLEPESKTFALVLWLFRWLLFRLMFLSGYVKAASDVVWRNLTALNYHYFTQPLPTPLGWLAAQMPSWFQSLSAAGMFFIELIVPFMIFLPRRVRYAAAVLIAGLQVLILLTGNYTFFNLLTLSLCLLLLDDTVTARALPQRVKDRLIYLQTPETTATRIGPIKTIARRIGAGSVAALVLITSTAQLSTLFLRTQIFIPFGRELRSLTEPFHIVNTYGLFATMTLTRPEISVEGSDDGEHWLVYTFKYKPGPLNRPPPIIAPFQPRLDWQMWFAALGPVSDSPWFLHFAYRLLQGAPEVVQLLETDPFPAHPPHYLRARLYLYTFTTPSELMSTGNWWKKTDAGMYMPAVALENFRVGAR